METKRGECVGASDIIKPDDGFLSRSFIECNRYLGFLKEKKRKTPGEELHSEAVNGWLGSESVWLLPWKSTDMDAVRRMTG